MLGHLRIPQILTMIPGFGRTGFGTVVRNLPGSYDIYIYIYVIYILSIYPIVISGCFMLFLPWSKGLPVLKGSRTAWRKRMAAWIRNLQSGAPSRARVSWDGCGEKTMVYSRYNYIVIYSFMGFIIQLITLDDLKWFRVITPNVWNLHMN